MPMYTAQSEAACLDETHKGGTLIMQGKCGPKVAATYLALALVASTKHASFLCRFLGQQRLQ